jgi:hypothetical protein
MHPFGADTEAYPNEFDLPSNFLPFSQVFELYLTDGISDRWTQSDFETLIGGIMSNDTTTTDDDVFGLVWSYFCREDADSNESHAGVRFRTFSGGPFTRVVIKLYDTADIPSPCNSAVYGNACKGYSWYRNGTNEIIINASYPTSMSDVLGLGIAHELQHVCYAASVYGLETVAGRFPAYDSINETFSTLAEYFLDSWRPLDIDISYDASFLRKEICDIDSKYLVERMWITYLYETFKGNAADPTDDLIYRWIRSSEPLRLMFHGLAATLWDGDFDWVGGVDLEERFNNVVANYAVAKFCNAPSFAPNARFGIDDLNTMEDFGLFLDNCTYIDGEDVPMYPRDCPDNEDGYPDGHSGCWNVRVLPPSYELGEADENDFATVAEYYTNGNDGSAIELPDTSHDTIDVTVVGTDYIVFRAGDYFADGGEHELQVRIEGEARQDLGEQPSRRVRPMA